MRMRKIIITILLAVWVSIGGQFASCATAEANGFNGLLLGILSSFLDGGQINPGEMRRHHDSMMDNFEQYMEYRMVATQIGMDLLQSGGIEVVQVESVQDEFLNGAFVDGLGETGKEMAKMPKYKFDGTSYKVFCERLQNSGNEELQSKANDFMHYVNIAHKYRDRMNDDIGFILSKTFMANKYNEDKRNNEIIAIIRDAQCMSAYENAIKQRGLDFNAMKKTMDEAIRVR